MKDNVNRIVLIYCNSAFGSRGIRAERFRNPAAAVGIHVKCINRDCKNYRDTIRRLAVSDVVAIPTMPPELPLVVDPTPPPHQANKLDMSSISKAVSHVFAGTSIIFSLPTFLKPEF